MKIGLRGGHSKNCIGAVGIVNEYEEMQKFFKCVRDLLVSYGHTVIDCNSNGATSNAELSEGATKANNADVDLFISLHMNAFNGSANGVECVVSSMSSGAYETAKKICNNFGNLGFKNRGVKFNRLYEMNHIKAPNLIFEMCFCDSSIDIQIYNKYSWEQLAHNLCNAIDINIQSKQVDKKAYIVTKYLPHAYDGYDGVDIKAILDKYFEGVKCYIKGDSNGIWIETEYLKLNKFDEIKKKLVVLIA